MSNAFRVRPVPRYDGATFPTLAAVEHDPGADTEESLARPVAAISLILLMLFFVVACHRQPAAVVVNSNQNVHQAPHAEIYISQPPVVAPPGPQVVVVPPPPVVVPVRPPVVVVPQSSCVESTRRCLNEQSIQICQGGRWVSQSCSEYCRNQRHDSFSNGCDASSVNPCRCVVDRDYDMVDGGMGYVEPNML